MIPVGKQLARDGNQHTLHEYEAIIIKQMNRASVGCLIINTVVLDISYQSAGGYRLCLQTAD